MSSPSVSFITGDVLAVLKTLPADYFDAVLSDPPYGLSFMGKEWDKGVPSAEVYRELLRVVKPGGFGLHFGGTRTFHRLACNLEDAGFELRDCISWLYGSGFPKSHNISIAIDKKAGVMGHRSVGFVTAGGKNLGYKDLPAPARDVAPHAPATPAARLWDGYGTALKPAWEPCLLVQKPLAGTFANNALQHGCGGLNIDGCRIGLAEGEVKTGGFGNGGVGLGQGVAQSTNGRGVEWQTSTEGRFPANLILDEKAAAALDEQVPSAGAFAPVKAGHSGKSRGRYNDYASKGDDGATFYGDKGGASRFFYCAKVGTKERNAGVGDKNTHPTMKPLALTTYLAKLLLVPARTDGQPRRVLVPFSGSGSEAIGCLLAGWEEVVGIELSEEYVAIAKARAEHHSPGSTAEKKAA